MCTVSISLIGKTDFVLTSNRDEAPYRISLAPAFYSLKGVKLLFPKDIKGGTWIGASENKHVVCVLNGAFAKHKRQLSYRKSRGLVVNDFLVSKDIVATIKAYNLNEIEPFTMIVLDWNSSLKFYEFVWDGFQKHLKMLSTEPQIWSSSTLYNKTMQKERDLWFKNFIINHSVSAKMLLRFHKTAGGDNMDYGVVMDREYVKTTSITQIEKRGSILKMTYESLETGLVTTKTFPIFTKVNG